MAAKDEILVRLAENRGRYLSGQKMADDLKVSRNAVWKAIERLKEEGYEIISGNGGYMLSSDNDRLIRNRIMSLLSTSFSDAGKTAENDSRSLPEVFLFETIDSTNNECKRRLAENRSDFVVLSENQTEGRGRNGKSFYSPKEKGLYMSVALKRAFPFDSAVMITTYTAVCVVEEIKRLTGISCGIKWVNDVFYEGKKVCGILTEAVADMESGMLTDLVVGIGIDLHPAELPEELQDTAGALDCGPVKNELAAGLIRRLLEFHPEDRSHMDQYREYSILLNRKVRFRQGNAVKEGIAKEILNDGSLVVRTEEGPETLRSGEVSLIL